MRYPILTNTKCAELARQLASGESPSIDPYVEWVGQADEVSLQPIELAADAIWRRALEWTDRDRDRFEGIESVVLLKALSHLPPEVLDDRGFWRFLALRYFWYFIAWREAGPFAKGNYVKYVDARTNTESVLPRMYLRAQAVGGSAHADLAGAIRYGTDFWRSHVIRVRTGSAPPITRALTTKQAVSRLPTDPLREAAKRLNRYWTNVVLHLYDDSDAPMVVDAIWDDGTDGRSTDGTDGPELDTPDTAT